MPSMVSVRLASVTAAEAAPAAPAHRRRAAPRPGRVRLEQLEEALPARLLAALDVRGALEAPDGDLAVEHALDDGVPLVRRDAVHECEREPARAADVGEGDDPVKVAVGQGPRRHPQPAPAPSWTRPWRPLSASAR